MTYQTYICKFIISLFDPKSKLVKSDFGDYSQRRTGSSQRRLSDEERENKLKESLRRTRYTEPDIEAPEKNSSFNDFLR